MEDKLNNINKCYDDIKIPNELDDVINKAIERKRKDKVIDMKTKRNIYFKRVGATAASLVLALGISVNASSTLAQSVYKIPVIGNIGKVITFRQYTIENDTSVGEVTVPHVENVDNKDVEDLINNMIQDKVQEITEEQAILDAEYKQAYLETGGTEEGYRKIEMTVDYKKYYASDDILSFEIFKYQTLASAYNENFYYNMNLETGDNITLKGLLGDDYVSFIKENVEKQMLSRMEENKDLSYDIDYFKEMEITEDRSFYIQENGDIVIIFAKYEVASGVMGKQEFVVGNINN